MSLSQLLYVSLVPKPNTDGQLFTLPPFPPSLLPAFPPAPENTHTHTHTHSCNPPDALSNINLSVHYARGSFFANYPTNLSQLCELSAASAPRLISVWRWMSRPRLQLKPLMHMKPAFSVTPSRITCASLTRSLGGIIRPIRSPYSQR